MKFYSLLAGLVACIFFAATPVQAANIIAVINTQELMQKSTAALSIKEQVDAKQKTFQTEMTKKEEQLNNEEQELRKQRSVLSPEAFEKKVKAFKTKAAAAQKEVQAKRAELDNAISTAFSQIQKAVFDITAQIAKEKGYIAVMPAVQFTWFDPSLDVTSDVITKLNSTLPKITVVFKAVASEDKAE
jgi:outer membrane protein